MRSPLLNEHATPRLLSLADFLVAFARIQPNGHRQAQSIHGPVLPFILPPKLPFISFPWAMRRWNKRAEKRLIAFARVLER